MFAKEKKIRLTTPANFFYAIYAFLVNFVKKHRYYVYYFFWLLLIAYPLVVSAHIFLLSDGYNCRLHTALFFLLIICCAPFFILLRELYIIFRHVVSGVSLSSKLTHKFFALASFALGYLFVSGIVFNWYYNNIPLPFEGQEFNFELPIGININNFLLSKFILLHLDLVAILIFGIFPTFVTTCFTNPVSAKSNLLRQIYDTFTPLPYFGRVIPLMKTIFEEKMNTVTIGAIINGIVLFSLSMVTLSKGINLNSYDKLQLLRWTFVTITAWLSSLSAWLFPFLMGLTTHLDSTISRTYNRKLNYIIDKLQDHTVIAGYGDLGKIAVNEIKQIVQRKDKFTYILIPSINLDFIRIKTDFVVIDNDEKLFGFVYSSTPDIKIGIAEIFIQGKEEVYAPAVVGNINLPSILERVNLLEASLVINVTKDEDSTFSILDFKSIDPSRGKTTNLILSFYRTSDKSYLITRGIETGQHFLYPIQVSGITIGDILYSFYKKNSLPCKNQTDNPICTKNLLIIGSGKQLFFILESFWIKIKEHFKKPEEAKAFFENNVSLLTNSSYIKEHSIKDEEDPNKQKWQIPLPRSVWMPFQDLSLEIPLALGSPTDLIHLQKHIQNTEPDYIVISCENGKETLDVLHELLVIAKRKEGDTPGKRAEKPSIIVSTKEKEKKDVKNVVFYWAGDDQDKRYPKQYPDGIVNFYEGSRGMIKGLVESATHGAHLNIKNKIKNLVKKDVSKPPYFEISLCLNNVSGATACSVRKMAGMEIGLNLMEKHIYIPSFLNFYSKVMDNEKWCFHAQTILIESKSIKLKENYIRALLINAEKETRETIKSVLDIEPSQKIEPRECVGRQVCSISTYSRHYDSNQWRINNYKKIPKERLTNIEKKTLDELEEENEKLIVCDAKLPSTSKTVSEDAIMADLVVCGNTNRPGVFAKVFNSFLFRTVRMAGEKTQSKEKVANINYIQSFNCYDSRFTFHKIFGEIVQADYDYDKKVGDFLDACLIYPITCSDVWLSYAKDLYNFLLTSGETQYRLYIDKDNPTNPTRILLIKEPIENLTFDNNNGHFRLDINKFPPMCRVKKEDCKLMYYFYRVNKFPWYRM